MPKAGSIKAGFRVPCPAILRANGKGNLHSLDVWLSLRKRLFAFCRTHGVMLFLNGECFRGLTRGVARTKLISEQTLPSPTER